MNLFPEEMRRDPYPLYDQMRSSSPVLHVAPLDLWMIFDHEGVKRALTDHEAFSSVVTPVTGKAPDWIIFSDPPRHTKLRAIVKRAFTARSVAALEPPSRARTAPPRADAGAARDGTARRGRGDGG
ncbi:hypothetical protein WMF18_00725 [Sorangium sp. So ce315]|uniref:hypothetical protein n=1 Tax=Sorangium sp. So ce315 TaxID=3133299 RepID=UPI003F627AA0